MLCDKRKYLVGMGKGDTVTFNLFLLLLWRDVNDTFPILAANCRMIIGKSFRAVMDMVRPEISDNYADKLRITRVHGH